MIIKQQRIMSVKKYFFGIKEGKEFQISIPLSSIPPTKIKQAGFPADMQPGDKILPANVGPISRFNAEGKWITRKDLPKESRYIQTRMWRWNQWSGRGHVQEQERACDIYKDCYPRELVPPPSEEITFVQGSDGPLFVSDNFCLKPENHELIKHTINLFLELFGECHVLHEGQKLLVPPKTKRVHWKILPVGQYPWKQLKPHVEERLKASAEEIQTVIHDRQQKILSFKPTTCVVGSGGFYDYIAYIFPEQNFVVLESIRLGNAIYVFESDWEEFSQLTKAEILTKNLHLERIIHAQGWKTKLEELFKNRKRDRAKSAV